MKGFDDEPCCTKREKKNLLKSPKVACKGVFTFLEDFTHKKGIKREREELFSLNRNLNKTEVDFQAEIN